MPPFRLLAMRTWLSAATWNLVAVPHSAVPSSAVLSTRVLNPSPPFAVRSLPAFRGGAAAGHSGNGGCGAERGGCGAERDGGAELGDGAGHGGPEDGHGSERGGWAASGVEARRREAAQRGGGVDRCGMIKPRSARPRGRAPRRSPAAGRSVRAGRSAATVRSTSAAGERCPWRSARRGA